VNANWRPCAFKFPSKVRRRFQSSCYPKAKKKKKADFFGKFPTEFVRSTIRADGKRRKRWRVSSRTYSACSRMHNSRRLFRSCRYWFRDASRRIEPVCVSFRLASSLFRQLAPLSAFSCFSIFPYLHSAASDFTPLPRLSVWPALFPDSRYFRIGMKPTGEKDAQRKRRREMKFKNMSIKWLAIPSFRRRKHGLITSCVGSTHIPRCKLVLHCRKRVVLRMVLIIVTTLDEAYLEETILLRDLKFCWI